MDKILSLSGLEVLDSRGNPTVACRAVAEGGQEAWAWVPSGASTGQNEALELRDGDKRRYNGKGVLKAIASINGALSDLLVGTSLEDLASIDNLMIKADGTENKSRFGANATLAVSLACARLAAIVKKEPLYAYLGGIVAKELPCPMLNIINGGVHADNSIDFQEFMIRPVGAKSFSEALRWGVEVYHVLRKILKSKGHVISVGDEGGFAPNLASHEEALEVIMEAIKEAGFIPGKDITLALDCAASELYKNGKYEGNRTYKEQVAYLESLVSHFPIDSIEDGLAEGDWEGWHYLTERLGSKVQIVGDDIFVTNPRFLQKGIDAKCANAILIKLNQIGTLTETLDTIALAQANGYACIISHRSGETEDSFIADLAVATRCGQIKTGAPCRSDRVAKYNRLLQIEQELHGTAVYCDGNRFKK